MVKFIKDRQFLKNMEKENIQPELKLQNLSLDMEKSGEELHKHFDDLLEARQELFDKQLNEGIEKHMNFLRLTEK